MAKKKRQNRRRAGAAGLSSRSKKRLVKARKVTRSRTIDNRYR